MLSARDFASIQCDGYKNINELVPDIHNQLHACETLFGDWDAQLLILAQDPANFAKIETLHRVEGREAYRHDHALRTNITLQSCLSAYLRNVDTRRKIRRTNRNCGVFYANAIWLLKASDGMQGRLSNLDAVMKACDPVFSATLQALKNVKCIIAVGQKAYGFLSRHTPLDPDWRNAALNSVVQYATIESREVLIGTTYHTGFSGSQNRQRAEPNALKDSSLLERDFDRVLKISGLLPA